MRRKTRHYFGGAIAILMLALTVSLATDIRETGGETAKAGVARAVTATPPASPKPTLPSDAKPPGEREPLVGLLAAASIVVAAGAGVYVYGVIRKGL